MSRTLLPSFNPDMMLPETLEAIFVQREALADEITECIRESVLTQAKHYRLLVGPRGIGKTHLIALLYHRIRAMDDLKDRVVIAWTREEEWGIASLLDLFVRILRTRAKEEGGEAFGEALSRVRALSGDLDAAERVAGEALRETCTDRVLLVLIENLDEVFRGLAQTGQERLRAYLQNNPYCAIVATSQSLFNAVSLQTSPFYGFFTINHLLGLTVDEASGLLLHIAGLQHDEKLAALIQTPLGRARVRAVHLLAGGNHRIYVILSQFLTRRSLDELVEAFLHTLDDLTPFYQARMSHLTPQQRKIVDFLCAQGGAAPVKEIAGGCFITHQTTSGQLKLLREMGYVQADALGREAYYELREPLMRLWSVVKRNRGEPVRLLVQFLRVWFTPHELEQRLQLAPPDAATERLYLARALEVARLDTSSPLVEACRADWLRLVKCEDLEGALQVAREWVSVDGGVIAHACEGATLLLLDRPADALVSLDAALSIDPGHSGAQRGRAKALLDLGRLEEALAAYQARQASEDADVRDHVGAARCLARLDRGEDALVALDRALQTDASAAGVWRMKGMALGSLARYEEALGALRRAAELAPEDADSWRGIGMAERSLGRLEESLAALRRAEGLSADDPDIESSLGQTLELMGRGEEALAHYDLALQADPTLVHVAQAEFAILVEMERIGEALAVAERATETAPTDAAAWVLCSVALWLVDRAQEALMAIDRALSLDQQRADAWGNRGAVLGSLGRFEEAVIASDRALELNPDNVGTWVNRAQALGELGRHEDALGSYERAVSLQDETADGAACLGRLVELVYLGRPEEEDAGLRDWLEHSGDDPQRPDRVQRLVRGLLLHNTDALDWARHLQTWVPVFEEHDALPDLGAAVVQSVRHVAEAEVSDATAQAWRDVWHNVGGARPELQLPLRLLDAAVEWKRNQDRRVLLRLPMEERKILEPLLELGEEA